MPNNRIGYQHINIVNIVPSAAMHTSLSVWVKNGLGKSNLRCLLLPQFRTYRCTAASRRAGSDHVG